MKRILLIAGIFMSLGLNAQMADGTVAPDFTATDINGNTHHLYDYLNDGKIVFMDISAAWCGPCWGFHLSHTMEDIQYAFGSHGSDEVVVFFVEGESRNTVDQLYGVSTANTYAAFSMGNWVEGSNYPIIDNASIANLYQIEFLPTLYRICPTTNQTFYVSHVNAAQTAYKSASELYAELQQCSTINGVENHAKVNNGKKTYVCDPSSVVLETDFTNYGTNDITSAVFELKENGNTVATYNYSGSISLFESADIAFDPITFNEGNTYTAELISINGAAPFNNSDEMKKGSFDQVLVSQMATSLDIEIHVTTDSWPTEISWDLRDSAGNVIYEVADYAGPDQNGPNADETFVYNVTLPNVNDCYSINYYDSYGDGWGSSADAGIEVVSNGVIIYSEQVGSFGAELNRDSAFQAGTLGTSDIASLSKFTVYPNPSNGMVNVRSNETTDIQIFDVSGKLVHSAKDVQNNAVLNLTKLPKGMYIVKAKGATKTEQTKLIIK